MPSAKAAGKLEAHDISMGGVSIVAASPVVLRTIHTINLVFGTTEVEHKVRVLHCRRNPEGGWLIGMAFIDRPLPGSATVAQLFNAILSSAITFS